MIQESNEVVVVLPCLRVESRVDRLFFFFQAEDGIRYLTVTGVQTCALPILNKGTINSVSKFTIIKKKKMSFEYSQEVADNYEELFETGDEYDVIIYAGENEIGRASCRERV